jgi:succinoglycan biosynthesis transport protein ExoP
MAWINAVPSINRSRRRAIAFVSALLFTLAAGLIYVYARPSEYRATARLKIAPAGMVSEASDLKSTPSVGIDATSFLSEVQRLTSRPLLETAFERLRDKTLTPDLGDAPVAEMQRLIRAEPIPGTQIVELTADSRQQALVAPLLNTVVEVYREEIAAVYRDSAISSYNDVKDEIGKLGQEIHAKRQAVDSFRAQYDIVSMEHKENDVLAQIAGLSQSYTEARNRLAKAQAHLQAVRNSIEAGKLVVRPKDDPVLTDIEQRASVLREQWQELQRRFTPAYLAFDPGAKSLQARLDALDNQVKAQRTTSARAALAEAQEEVAAAQAATEKLRQDVAENQKQAQEFASHLNEYKALQQDIDHLEGMHRAALDRQAKLQASEKQRAPRIDVLQAASPSLTPYWPDYNRDALIAVAGSVLFGLFAAWLADFLSGPQPFPAFPDITLQHSWVPMLQGGDIGLKAATLAAPASARLPAPSPMPRQLDDPDIAALIAAANEDTRFAVLALLSGLTAEEVVALSWEEVDLPDAAIRVAGAYGRSIPIEDPLRGLLEVRRERQPEATGAVLRRRGGTGIDAQQLREIVQHAAYDAGLDQPQEVTPPVLRYTWLAFLLRQGLRAADVAEIAGPVPHEELMASMEIHSPKIKQPAHRIDRVLPILRQLAASDEGRLAS